MRTTKKSDDDDGVAQKSSSSRLERLRETLGYKATLKRGYAVVRADDGIVTTKNAAKAAKRLEVEFKDGRLLIAGEQDPDQTSRPRKSTRIDRGIDKPDQGSLF